MSPKAPILYVKQVQNMLCGASRTLFDEKTKKIFLVTGDLRTKKKWIVADAFQLYL